ncbi:MAG: TonB-dependent receptor plug domain-containing protein [Gammaproteobacteria bacterium]|nr:TonB-dependent receptor plug domain-containing protein [Gammaproteobacteria bacterium]
MRGVSNSCAHLGKLIYLVLLMFSAAGYAGEQLKDETRYHVDIPPMNAAEALNSLAGQTGITMLFPYDLASSRRANAVRGHYTLQHALDLMLRGTGLTGSRSDKGVLMISRTSTALIDKEDTAVKENEQLQARPVNKTSLLAGITALFASAVATPVATGQTTQAGTAGLTILEEITVTARKREENLQNVPISVTAFNAEQIEQLGIINLLDLDTHVVNLSLGGGDNTGGTNFVRATIRGVGTQARINTDGAVGLYLDGVYVPRMTGTLLDLLDVENIEVLRGPQGTLFGRNTTGGAIRYNSKRPHTEKFEGYIKAGYGSRDLIEVTGMANIPLGEKAAIRVSAYSRDQDGYVDNMLGNIATATDPSALQYDSHGTQELGDYDNWGVRASLRFQPADALTVDLTGAYTEDKGNGPAFKLTDWNLNARRGEGEPCRMIARGVVRAREVRRAPGGVCTLERARSDAFNGVAETNSALDPVLDNAFGVLDGDNTQGGIANYEKITTEMLSAEISWDINEYLTATSRTGYLNIEPFYINDNDYTPVIWRERVRDYKNDSFSQEVLINGDHERLNWTAGVFYFEETPEELTTGSDNGTPDVFIREETLDAESIALFAEGSYWLFDNLSVTLGYRWTEDKKELTAFGDGPIRSRDRNFDPASDPDILALINGPGIPSSASAGDTWRESTWRASIQYHWTDNVMTYFTASTGYTSGSFNNELELKFGPSENFGILPFEAEEVDLYEAGFRSTLADGRIRFNATGFFQDWTGRQLRKIQPDGTRFVTNAGNAETYGAEIDVTFQVTESLNFAAAVGILDGEWTTIAPEVSDQILIDSELARLPDLTFSLALNHTAFLDFGSVRTSVSYGWRADQYSSDAETRTIEIDSYGLMTGRIEYATVDEKWALALSCRNCLDEDYINTGVDFTGTTMNQARVRDLGREGYRVEQIGEPLGWFLEIKRSF